MKNLTADQVLKNTFDQLDQMLDQTSQQKNDEPEKISKVRSSSQDSTSKKCVQNDREKKKVVRPDKSSAFSQKEGGEKPG